MEVERHRCRLEARLSRKFVPGVVDEHDALRG
jgi:hypothetical protein